MPTQWATRAPLGPSPRGPEARHVWRPSLPQINLIPIVPVLSLVALLLYERTLCRCDDSFRHSPFILPPTHYRLDRSYQKIQGALPCDVSVLRSFGFDIVWLRHVRARRDVTWRKIGGCEGADALTYRIVPGALVLMA